MIKKGVEMNPFCDYCPCFNHTISFTYAGYVNELKHPFLFNGVGPFQETEKISEKGEEEQTVVRRTLVGFYLSS